MSTDAEPTAMSTSSREELWVRLHARVQQLILMRETGPKSAAWHRARVRTIWRLQQRMATLACSDPPPADDSRPPIADS